MADRFLIWHLTGSAAEYSGKAQVRETFTLEADYTPRKVWIYAKTPPTGQPLQIDINSNGSSIFVDNPQLAAGQTQTTKGTFQSYQSPNQRIGSGAVVTLDVDQVGSAEAGRDITITLQLRS